MPDDRFLDPRKVIETVEALERRISERFAGSGLSRLCGRLREVAREAEARGASLAKPIWPLRAAALALAALLVAGLVGAVVALAPTLRRTDFFDLVQASEAAVSETVMMGAGIFFLWTLETRVRRKRALSALHELRSIAHIIDMHQLTKDPERVGEREADTPSSPKRSMSPFELNRYLDYASEMLSLTGKVAALYAQHLTDTEVLEAVNEVESLTTGLSRKIWQKIMILESRPA